MLTIWFIDDNDNFFNAIRECLGLQNNCYHGIYNKQININLIDPGVDGKNIIERIKNLGHASANIPDFIFLDLRFPIDKRLHLLKINEVEKNGQNQKNINDSIINPLNLHGVKVLDEIAQNNILESCMPIIFSEVALNSFHKEILEKKLNINNRKLLLVEKFEGLKDTTLTTDSISGFSVTKNCDSLKAILNLLMSKTSHKKIN